MVDRYFVALQNTRENLSAKRQTVCAIQMTAIMLFNVFYHLCGLVINGRETRLLAEREPVHFGSDDTKPAFHQLNT